MRNRRDAARSLGASRLEALYDELLPVVFGYARSRLSEADAEDVTGEVFRAALEVLCADPDAELSRSWFLVSVRNRIIDRWRRQLRWDGRLEVLRRDVDGSAFSGGGGSDAEDQVLEALDRLTPDHRSVLVLRYVDGLRAREIGAVLDRSTRAVESLLARARRELAVAFEEVSR